MPTPHKHAAVIKAWADGHQVQMLSRMNGLWEDVNAESPRWLEHYEYRVKPTFVKYRNFLWAPADSTSCRWVVCVVTPEDQARDHREVWSGFIQWIGDWQEVEV
jgi:hypothetical protein